MQVTDPESAGCSSDRLARIRPAMQAWVDRGLYAGMSTLVARRGGIVHAEHVGCADVAAATPMTADTLFRVYSMTKPIAATVLMTLYEEGRFQLTDPVSKHLPAFASLRVLEGQHRLVEPKRPPTVRDLLTHTAGFTYHFSPGTPVAALYGESIAIMNQLPLAEAMTELAQLPLAVHPGSSWHYGVNIDVAAYLAQVLADQPFDDLLRERVLAPLGMEHTFFCVPAAERARVATTYGVADLAKSDYRLEDILEGYTGLDQLTPIDVQPSSPMDVEGFARGGHGLIMTIGDYARFAQMLCNGGELDGNRILGPKTAALMHSNHLPAQLLPFGVSEDLTFPGYGFGLASRVLMDPAAAQLPGSVGEFGWGGAANTYFWVDPAEQLVGVFMAQKMTPPDAPQLDFRVMTYAALVA